MSEKKAQWRGLMPKQVIEAKDLKAKGWTLQALQRYFCCTAKGITDAIGPVKSEPKKPAKKKKAAPSKAKTPRAATPK